MSIYGDDLAKMLDAHAMTLEPEEDFETVAMLCQAAAEIRALVRKLAERGYTR